MPNPAPTAPAPWTPPARLPTGITMGRVQLRFFTQDDAQALFQAVEASRSSMLPWLPWARTQHLTVEAAASSIARFAASAADPLEPENNAVFGYILGAFCRETGTLIGGTGFNRMSAPFHNAETGYWVRADRRREGWCTQMLRAGLSIGLMPQDRGGFGFRRIHIFASAANNASCGVPPKLGLHQCGCARLDRFVDTIGWTDTLAWDVLASEWDCAAGRLS